MLRWGRPQQVDDKNPEPETVGRVEKVRFMLSFCWPIIDFVVLVDHACGAPRVERDQHATSQQ
jgi:hypothetical protein